MISRILKLFIYFAIVLAFSSCKHRFFLLKNVITKITEKNDTIGSFGFKNMLLAREVCNLNQFNFCDDGEGNPFRLYPAFVELNRCDFIASYDNIYMFPTPEIMDSLKKRKMSFSTPWELDSLFYNGCTDENLVAFNIPKLKRKIKKLSVAPKNVVFDNNLYYSLFNIDFQYIYGGRSEVLIPNLNKKNLA